MASLRILIAEDEAIIAMLLGEVLTGLGHTICATAATEEEAVAAARAHLPDLIIIDAGLREGSGLSAMRRINAAHPTPHLFTTGNVMGVRAALPRAIILEKPFNEIDLIMAIDRARGQYPVEAASR